MAFIKSELSGLWQFSATENPFKMMKDAFYFTLKAPFVLEIFQFLNFWSCRKWLDKKTNKREKGKFQNL